MPSKAGRQDSFSAAFLLKLQSNYQYRSIVPQSAIDRMLIIPSRQDCIPTEEQLKAWIAYVKIEERRAKESQFHIEFLSP